MEIAYTESQIFLASYRAGANFLHAHIWDYYLVANPISSTLNLNVSTHSCCNNLPLCPDSTISGYNCLD
jgi:hypothetical protein